MEISKLKLPKSEYELTVEVSPKELEPYMESAAKKISKEVKIPGFRPGMAPRKIVEDRIGHEKVFELAVKDAVPKTFLKAVEQEKLEVVGKPEITPTKLAEGNPLVYKAKFAILPEISLPDFSKIKAKRKKVKVEEKEITQNIEALKKRSAKIITVNREAREGDQVEVDFETFLNEIPVEGGKSKNHPILLGSKTFIPGFEEKLIGVKAGDKKEFALQFPKDYAKKDFAGKKVEFKVNVNLVSEVTYPKFDDEFAKAQGNFKTADELKKQIEQNILAEKERKEEDRLEMEIVDKIASQVDCEIPEVVTKAEQDRIIQETKQNLMSQGVPFDKYLESIQKTEDEFKKSQLEAAMKRAKLGLILLAVQKKEKVELPHKELMQELEKMKDLFKKMYKDNQAMIEHFNSDEYRQYLGNMMINRKIFKKLKELCKINEG